jgi:hypothetical protein
MGSQVDPRAILDLFGEKKFFLSLLGFEPHTIQLIALSLYWLHSPSSESHMDCPAIEPRSPWWKLLSYQSKYILYNFSLLKSVSLLPPDLTFKNST